MPVFFPQGSARPTPATRDFAVCCVGFGLSQNLVGWLFGVRGETAARWWVRRRAGTQE